MNKNGNIITVSRINVVVFFVSFNTNTPVILDILMYKLDSNGSLYNECHSICGGATQGKVMSFSHHILNATFYLVSGVESIYLFSEYLHLSATPNEFLELI